MVGRVAEHSSSHMAARKQKGSTCLDSQPSPFLPFILSVPPVRVMVLSTFGQVFSS
jgi:hypothetical protein